MKKIKYVIILIFLLILSSYCTEIIAEEQLSAYSIIRAKSEPDYPPFCIINEDGEPDGFSVDLLKAVVKEMNLELTIEPGIWNEIKNELVEGKIDILPLVGRSPERATIFDFTIPYHTLHGAVFIRKGNKNISSFNDLQDKEIIVMKGDNADEFITRENVSDKIIRVPTFEDAFRLLSNSTHDAVIAQRLMGITLLNEMNLTSIEPLDIYLERFNQDFSFAVTRGNKELLAKLDEGLALVMADGTYEELYRKWFNPESTKVIPLAKKIKYALFVLIPILVVVSLFYNIILRKILKKRTIQITKQIEEEHELQLRLQKIEERWQFAIDGSELGLWDWNITANEIFFSNQCKLMLGYDQDDLSDNLDNWKSLIHPDDKDRVDEDIQAHLDGDTSLYLNEHRLKCKDGTFLWILARGKIINYDINGKPLRMIGTHTDITERKDAEQRLRNYKETLEGLYKDKTAELENRNKELDESQKALMYLMEDMNETHNELVTAHRKLEEANKELESFSYSVSHDLRAPLRAIDSFTKILEEEYNNKFDEEGKRILKIIMTNSQNMNLLITDLLRFSRTGRQKLNIVEIDTNETIQSIINGLKLQYHDRDVEFKYSTLHNVWADRGLFQQVIENILQNAFKYTRVRKTAIIKIASKIENENIVFSIQDNGVGFNMKYKDKLFQVFQRLHSASDFEGTGIGLALVQRIVEKHNGNIWAEGVEDKGSTFYFSFPQRNNS